MISVFIVDDHEVVREGLRRMLEKTVDLRITAEAPDVATAMKGLREGAWQVMLLDVAMPGICGIDGIDGIRKAAPEMAVLMFSGFADVEYATACIRAGACGYVVKDSPPGEIRDAIRAVAAGGKFVSPGLDRRLRERGDADVAGRTAPHERLTAREMDILRRIGRGQALTDIGLELHLSVKTVSTHRSNILEKMGMTSNAHLIRYVVERRLDPGMADPDLGRQER